MPLLSYYHTNHRLQINKENSIFVNRLLHVLTVRLVFKFESTTSWAVGLSSIKSTSFTYIQKLRRFSNPMYRKQTYSCLRIFYLIQDVEKITRSRALQG